MKTSDYAIHALSLGLVLVLGSGTAAQSGEPGGPALPQGTNAPTSIVDQSFGAGHDANGLLLGGGPTYKAVFDTHGMEFVPALGRKARSQPLRFSLDSIRRGGTVVHQPATTEPELGGNVVTFARGAGIVERYDVRLDGVEMSFTFPNRLPGTGDLVVRGKVDTSLEAAVGDHTDGLTFATGRLGGVKFGGVTGIDALGAKTSGSLRWDGSYLELVLPGDFVERAIYPLVLDPLVGAVFDVDTAFDSTQPDVSYDASTAQYLVVFPRDFGTDNIDVRAQRVNANGTLNGGTLFLTSNGVNINPAVANVNGADTWVVAWQNSASTFGTYDIEAMAVKGTDLSAIFDVAATAGNEITPDVSGERSSSTAQDDAIIVWNDEGNGIWAAQFDVGAGPPASIPFVFDTTQMSTFSTDDNPAISKSGGGSARHLIVWEFSTNDLRGRVVDRDLTTVGTTRLAIDSNGHHPDCDGNGSNFMCVFDRYESGSSGPRDVWCQALTATSSSLVLRGNEVGVETGVADDERHPAVGYLGSKFAVAWSDGVSLFNSNIIMQASSPTDCGICGSSQPGFGTSTFDEYPAIGAQWPAGSGGDQCLVVWEARDATPPFVGDVMAVRFEAFGPSAGGAVTTVAARCGGGGTASIVGAFAAANTVRVTLGSADPTATIAALHMGDAVTPLAPCFACSILQPFLAVPVPYAAGSASTALTLGCSPALIGQAFRFQYVVGNTATAPCLGIPAGFSNVLNAVYDW